MQKFIILYITGISNFTAGVTNGLLTIPRRTFPRGSVPRCSVPRRTFQRRRRRALRGAESFDRLIVPCGTEQRRTELRGIVTKPNVQTRLLLLQSGWLLF